jgi:uncharacterized protein YbcC (UPF0753/DUF2309 family)
MKNVAEFARAGLPGLESAALAAARAIPPSWPLSNAVAVNPFLGHTGRGIAHAGAKLGRAGAIPAFMPRKWFAERIASGEILDEDLKAALAASPHAEKPADVAALKLEAQREAPAPSRLADVLELAEAASGTGYPAIFADRFGAWAAAFFDRGQALWPAPKGRRAWAAWREWATHDLTPEILGLPGFAAFVAELPQSPMEAIGRASARLGLQPAMVDSHFPQALIALGGWAQYARHLMWDAELEGRSETTLIDFLAIRLAWEEAVYAVHEHAIAAQWEEIRTQHGKPAAPGGDEIASEILLEAAERAAQRRLNAQLSTSGAETRGPDRPALQAYFCIDVRSEVFRRALESVDTSIRTGGFAGFFGLGIRHRRFASDVGERRLPVLIGPAVETTAAPQGAGAKGELAARHLARAKRAWGRFKVAAVSSFAFVEAMGPAYLARLVADGLSLPRGAAKEEPAPHFQADFGLEARIAAAGNILRAMALTEGFAPLVLLAGHGANVVNNPFASALHCGACGGHSGEVNARLLAGMLNDAKVRDGLREQGIDIPADTLFVPALHDTTTDQVAIHAGDLPAGHDASRLRQLRQWLALAGRLAREERARKLPGAGSSSAVAARARDWAQVRPEWGLAGCSAFIAAPRMRTSGRALEGRAFLHDYDWRADKERGYGVLELILTAPVVVASWISLQYYGSAVAPEAFGSGNKLLHNVVGGIGVLEGNGGNLRAGLAWQSVHDGEKLMHDPLRLTVAVEAPREAITAILERHAQVRELFDNRWLYLFAMDETGALAWRYAGNLQWVDAKGAGAHVAAPGDADNADQMKAAS